MKYSLIKFSLQVSALILTGSLLSLLTGCKSQNTQLFPDTDSHYQLHTLTDRYGKKHIILPQCPNTTDEKGNTVVYKNYGCSTTKNLGQMIADPNDINPSHTNPSHNTRQVIKAMSNLHADSPATVDAPKTSRELQIEGY